MAGDDDEDANGVFYSALRNSSYTYVSNASGETELYDLGADPFQLSNQVANPAYDAAEAALAARLARLRTCAALTCRSKPALKLNLPRAKRRNGRSCRQAGRFVARVRARLPADSWSRALASGGGRAPTAAPFRKRLTPRLLRRKPRPEIQVFAGLLDGRTVSLQKRVRICR